MTDAPGGALSGTAAIAQAGAYQPNVLLSENFSLYGQDTWKITRRFTLTYGLRWDVNPPLKGKNAANDPFTVVGLNNPVTIALAPRGTPLYQTTYGNVAPRFGLAWQVGAKQNWISTLRGGFGAFYDLGQGSLGATTSYFPYFTNRNIPQMPTPFPLSPGDAAPPAFTLNPPVSNIIVADPHLKLPRTWQWNVALEQAIGGSQSLSLTYVGAIGSNLLRPTNLFDVNPNFQAISLTDNSATSDYHALQLKFQRRMSHGLEALASYTFSHSIDSSSTDAYANYLSTPGLVANPNIDRGNSDFDIRHSFTSGVSFDLPSRGRGWSVDAFLLARSAAPVNVIGGAYNTAGISLQPRPNVNKRMPGELYGSGYPGGKIFNKAAFAAAPAGQQGDFGRNVLRGFGTSQADIGVQRMFRVTERIGLRFRAEFFNLLNHPNFGPPTNSLTNALFGRSTQTLANALGSGGANGGFNPLYQIGGPRSIQLALKVQF